MSSPDGVKAGQVLRASVGQGWAISYSFYQNAKLNSLEESKRKNWGFCSHSLLERSHLDGAKWPCRKSPSFCEAVIAGDYVSGLMSGLSQTKMVLLTQWPLPMAFFRSPVAAS